ncbi:MAG: galactokinase [Oscillospiraceae bacterium]|nr:galactokinase [Oscillospiraceae bacterium]
MKELRDKFHKTFGERSDVRIYSAPGRVELGGNHTDHQRGSVLAASVSLDMRAAVAKNESSFLRVKSEGYPQIEIDITDLAPRESEKNTTASLVRGVADGMVRRGKAISGADMYVVSDVLRGSGLSSSAAFEVLVGTALSDMFESGFSAEEIAEIGQYAETVHFGKPSGLMDQMASSVGGIVAIDFLPEKAAIEKIECDIAEYGYDLVIIDAGADHADLTDEYASIPGEMKSVAACLDKEVLGEVDEAEFYENIADIRAKVGDRAVLRAVHFFRDSRCAAEEAACLRRGDFEGFLKLISASGDSSFKYLQNIYVAGDVENQAMAYALAVCEELLGGRGAVRIQGGGFGGTLEAFVPCEMTERFCLGIDRMIGKDMCKVLTIRAVGGVRLG